MKLRLVYFFGVVSIFTIFILAHLFLWPRVFYLTKVICVYPNRTFEVYEYVRLASYEPIVIQFFEGTEVIVNRNATCTVRSMSTPE
jgi:hypothetical protein